MGYILKYESVKNEYSIVSAHTMKSIDPAKISEEVKELKQNLWICKTKDPLKEYSESHKAELIEKHLKAIERIQKRTLTEVKQKYKIG